MHGRSDVVYQRGEGVAAELAPGLHLRGVGHLTDVHTGLVLENAYAVVAVAVVGRGIFAGGNESVFHPQPFSGYDFGVLSIGKHHIVDVVELGHLAEVGREIAVHLGIERVEQGVAGCVGRMGECRLSKAVDGIPFRVESFASECGHESLVFQLLCMGSLRSLCDAAKVVARIEADAPDTLPMILVQFSFECLKACTFLPVARHVNGNLCLSQRAKPQEKKE